ncbi:MAG TPA: biotin/lipoyl-binding protein [Ruminiclostridium sp.]
MNLSKIVNFEINKKGLKTVQGKAIKLLAGFLALMLLFTILSRSAYSFTTPKVTTTTISSMSIEHDMNISGQIYANRDVLITTQPNILILSVDVAEGAPVKTGDVLFRLDLNDLDKQLQLAKDQLKKMELQQTDETSGKEIIANDKKKTVDRAIEDYYRVLSTENNNVQKALDELNDLGSSIDAQKAKILEENTLDIQKRQKAIDRATEDYNNVLASSNQIIQSALDEMNGYKNITQQQRAKILSNQGVNVINKQTQVNRAIEDYNNTLAVANISVQRAYDTMTGAKSKLDKYLKTGSDEEIIAELETDYNIKKQTYADALVNKENSLLSAQRAKDDANSIIITDISEQLAALDTANNAKKQAYDDALKNKASNLVSAQRAIDDANAIAIPNYSEQITAIDINYKAKKDTYNQAVIDKEYNILSAQRIIDDANGPLASDHGAELALIDMKAVKDNIEQMELLNVNNGEIKTPKNGTVKKLNVTEGTQTSVGVAVLLTDASLGYCFKAKVDRDMAMDLSKDDAVKLKLNGEDSALENLKIDSVYVTIEDSNFFQIIVNIPPNLENLGSTANIEIKKQSEMYSSCVPLDAVHADGIKTYVLAIADKKTVLGSETTAERIDIVVEDKNDTTAAINSDFASEQKLIISTTKPIQPGDRVRVEEE